MHFKNTKKFRNFHEKIEAQVVTHERTLGLLSNSKFLPVPMVSHNNHDGIIKSPRVM